MHAIESAVFPPLDEHERRALRSQKVTESGSSASRSVYDQAQKPSAASQEETEATVVETSSARPSNSSALPRLRPLTVANLASPASPASQATRASQALPFSRPSESSTPVPSKTGGWYVSAFAIGIAVTVIAALLLHYGVCTSPPALAFRSHHGSRLRQANFVLLHQSDFSGNTTSALQGYERSARHLYQMYDAIVERLVGSVANTVIHVGRPSAVQAEMQRSFSLITKLEDADLTFNESLAAAIAATQSFHGRVVREQEQAKKRRKHGVPAKKEEMQLRKALVDEAQAIVGNLTTDGLHVAEDVKCLKNVYSNLRFLNSEMSKTDLRSTYTQQLKRLIHDPKERAVFHDFLDSLLGELYICRLF